MDIAEVQTVEGKLYFFVGVDRTSKFVVTQLVDKAGSIRVSVYGDQPMRFELVIY